MRVKLRAAVCRFPNDMKGQSVVYITWPIWRILCSQNLPFYLPHFSARCVVEMIDLCSFVGRKTLYQSKRNQSSYLGLEFHLDISTNCACMTFRNCCVYIAGEKRFLALVLLHSLSIAQVESCICCKTVTGLRKNMFFIYPFHLSFPCTKIALKNALLLGIFQSAKTSNLLVLLNQSKNTLLGNVFTLFCCNCDSVIIVISFY